MRNLIRTGVLLAGSAAMTGVVGCTVYPEHKTPTLATTTSAEQTQRIFWKDVEAGKWTEVNALLAPNVVWRAGDHVLDREAVVPWLKGLGLQTVLVADTTVKSNLNDLTLVYALQVKGRERVIPRSHAQPNAGASENLTNCLQNLHAVAVWQQSQPGNAGAAKNIVAPYLLTVEDLSTSSSANPSAAADGSAPCQEP